ncbi:MAG: hypothetical protein ACE5LB_09385, partial [Acidiferrobacterales bacterium]
MTRTLAVLAGATLLILVASCRDEEAFEELPPQDAGALSEQALAAMDGLDSFRMEMGFGSEGPPIVIEFADPDSYRIQLGPAETAAGLAESIIVGDRSYNRQCEGVDRG